MLKYSQKQSMFPIVAEKLCYTTPTHSLIKDLSFQITEQGISTFMGPNGAGKSLTLRLLHGLIKPTSGTVHWGSLKKQEEARKYQAMVFQKPVLLRRTVEENLRYPLKIKGVQKKSDQSKHIEEALNLANLTRLAKSPARQLSGGEQQRLAIARALMLKPAILFLDEPSSSLDPSATQAIEDLIITAQNEGVKIFLVTHDIGQAKRLSNEILFLNKGRLVEQGPAKDRLNTPQSKPMQQYIAGEIVTGE